jgi:putative ABC transport system ATP-binding protein
MVISVKNLTVEYRAGAESFLALDVPAWEVAEHEQVAISGPSGSGKSTLLNVVAGLLAPTGGSVEVCGRQLAGLGEAERDRFRAAHVSYIFQTFNLLEGYTALENVLLGASFSAGRLDRAQAHALLEKVGLTHRLNHYPSKLSIGEQQRVAIARALAKKPQLILADEPTGSLDPRHAAGVVKLLRDACREHGCALVVVSHETKVVAVFDTRVNFLDLNHALAGAASTPSGVGGAS